jgi:N-acetyl-gamma-glutamyl-phosphate/LysW-gamma-L-alpha-aminoadipyl-6-phosphate reductase
MRAAVIGGSGYIGGELVRLLLGHPAVDLVQVTSDSYAGKPLHTVHPNLRGTTSLRFTAHDDLEPADAVFLALPHGAAMHQIQRIEKNATYVFDLSADFRFKDADVYRAQFGSDHQAPEYLSRFVAGLPELHRRDLRDASHVSVPGCMATAAIIGLHPLARSGLMSPSHEVVIDALTGSSGSGHLPTVGSHHAERSGAMRLYEPFLHRHHVEVDQMCGVRSQMTVTAVEAVRGVRVVAHVTVPEPVNSGDLWSLYRAAYEDEPFVRLVAQRGGMHRWPEPKILAGSNYCDVGFVVDSTGHRVLLIAALDNLVKGGAGNAVQCLNVIAGWDEAAGLGFTGLHPV